jgi:antitoxin VapB
MSVAIPAKVFRHDDGQAVAIPRGLKLPTGDILIRQDGPRLVIEPAIQDNPNAALLALLASWDPIDEEIGPIDELPLDPINL